MLNQAWAFWTMGNIALYAAIGLAIAALGVAGMLVFELFFAKRETTNRFEQPLR